MSRSDLRRDYSDEPLDEARSDRDPFRQFSVWFEQAVLVEADPTAMALATATSDGRPSVRTVLLKGVDEKGLLFFTNYHSRKAREMDETGTSGGVLTMARGASPGRAPLAAPSGAGHPPVSSPRSNRRACGRSCGRRRWTK